MSSTHIAMSNVHWKNVVCIATAVAGEEGLRGGVHCNSGGGRGGGCGAGRGGGDAPWCTLQTCTSIDAFSMMSSAVMLAPYRVNMRR